MQKADAAIHIYFTKCEKKQKTKRYKRYQTQPKMSYMRFGHVLDILALQLYLDPYTCNASISM